MFLTFVVSDVELCFFLLKSAPHGFNLRFFVSFLLHLLDFGLQLDDPSLELISLSLQLGYLELLRVDFRAENLSGVRDTLGMMLIPTCAVVMAFAVSGR